MQELVNVLDAILRKFSCADCRGWSIIMIACEDGMRCYTCAVHKFARDTYTKIEKDLADLASQ